MFVIPVTGDSDQPTGGQRETTCRHRNHTSLRCSVGQKGLMLGIPLGLKGRRAFCRGLTSPRTLPASKIARHQDPGLHSCKVLRKRRELAGGSCRAEDLKATRSTGRTESTAQISSHWDTAAHGGEPSARSRSSSDARSRVLIPALGRSLESRLRTARGMFHLTGNDFSLRWRRPPAMGPSHPPYL